MLVSRETIAASTLSLKWNAGRHDSKLMGYWDQSTHTELIRLLLAGTHHSHAARLLSLVLQ